MKHPYTSKSEIMAIPKPKNNINNKHMHYPIGHSVVLLVMTLLTTIHVSYAFVVPDSTSGTTKIVTTRRPTKYSRFQTPSAGKKSSNFNSLIRYQSSSSSSSTNGESTTKNPSSVWNFSFSTKPPQKKKKVENKEEKKDAPDQEELLKYLDSNLSISFAEFQRQQKLLKYVSGCPIFANQSPDDRQRLIKSMELVQIQEGEAIIQQGVVGDAMYFLESGSLECVTTLLNEDADDDTPILLTTYDQEGQYFGEVSLLFGQPRKASIRALENCTLYKIRKEAFRESMLDTRVYDTARDLILKKYMGGRLRDVILKLSSGEIMDLLRAKLQPQQELVSVESQLRLFAWGAASNLFFGILSIGGGGGLKTSSLFSSSISNNNNPFLAFLTKLPRLYNINNPLPAGSAFLTLSLFAALSFVATAADKTTGTTNFSKKLTIEWLSLGFWWVGLASLVGSNGSGTGLGTIIPKFLLTVSMVGGIRNTFTTLLAMNQDQTSKETFATVTSAATAIDDNVKAETNATTTKDEKISSTDTAAATATSVKPLTTRNVILTTIVLGLANLGLFSLAIPLLSGGVVGGGSGGGSSLLFPTLPGLITYLCIATQMVLSFLSPGASRFWIALTVGPWIAWDAIVIGMQTIAAASLPFTTTTASMSSSLFSPLLTLIGNNWKRISIFVGAAWYIVNSVQAVRDKASAKPPTPSLTSLLSSSLSSSQAKTVPPTDNV